MSAILHGLLDVSSDYAAKMADRAAPSSAGPTAGAEGREQLAAEAVVVVVEVGRDGLAGRPRRPRRPGPRAAPASASRRTMSPSRTLAIGPPSTASGVRWMAAGHLARGARHAAVGDQRHLAAAVLQHAQRRRQLVQLGHAVGLRALEADHGDEVAVELAALEAPRPARPGRGRPRPAPRPRRCCGFTAETLITARPRLPVEQLEAAVGAERAWRPAQDVRVAADRRRRRARPGCRPSSTGVLAVARQPALAGDGADVRVQQPGVEQLADQEAPCRRRRGSGSRRRGRSGRCGTGAARSPTASAKSSQISRMPAARGHGDQVDGVVGRAAGRHAGRRCR